MANRKKFTVRKTVQGSDRASSMYLVERVNHIGRSVSAGYRFSKVARSEATSFRSEAEATKIMKSLRNRDSDGVYSVITL